MQRMPNEILERVFAHADEDPEGGCGIIALVCSDWRALVLGSRRLKRKRVDLGTLCASVTLLRGVWMPMRWPKGDVLGAFAVMARAGDTRRMRALYVKTEDAGKLHDDIALTVAKHGRRDAWDWYYRCCLRCAGTIEGRDMRALLDHATVHGGADMLAWLQEVHAPSLYEALDGGMCRLECRLDAALWLATAYPEHRYTRYLMHRMTCDGRTDAVDAMRELGVEPLY